MGRFQDDLLKRTFMCIHSRAEQLLLKAASTGRILDKNFTETCKHFGEDFDHSKLRNQLTVLHDIVGSVNPSLQDICKAILPQVCFLK